MNDYITYEDVEVFTTEIVEEFDEIEQVVLPTSEPSHNSSTGVSSSSGLTPDLFTNGVNDIVNAIQPDEVTNEVYRDSGMGYAIGDVELPEYAVSYEVNGVSIYFPTEYAEDIFVIDGMLVNLGANYTAGAVLSGSGVSNYLSSEITIPTYHSSTWYQYMQNYGQPYRIVDRYYNNYGSIGSSTRESVDLEFSGSRGWHGFTFANAMLLIIGITLFITLIFRKGR